MKEYLPYIALAALAVSVITFAASHLRTAGSAALGDRCSKLESKLDLLIQFLMKGAVLSFHSPDIAHQRTDSIIEKLVEDRDVTAGEIELLVDRIKQEAHHADDKKRRLEAVTTLALIDQFFESVVACKGNALGEYE